MANTIQIQNLPTTATIPASDDYIAISGTTNGARKMLATAGLPACVNVREYGAKGDGVTNDAAAIVAAAAATSTGSIEFSGGTFLVSTSITPAHGRWVSYDNSVVKIVSPGAIVFTNCAVDVSGIIFEGNMSEDQYAVAVTGAQVSTAFATPTYQDTGGSNIAKDFTATKSGTQMTIGPSPLTGALIRSVTSDFITVDPSKRYVFNRNGASADSYGALRSVTFLCYDGSSAYLSTYNPAADSTYYSFIEGTSKVKVRISVQQFTSSTTALQTVYNLDTIELLELKNQSSTFSKVTPPNATLVQVGGNCTTPRFEGCQFRNFATEAITFISSKNILFCNNKISYCWSGVGINSCTGIVANNSIDLRQRGGSSVYNLKALRFKCIGAVDSPGLVFQGNTLLGASWAIEVTGATSVVTADNNTIKAEYTGISIPEGVGNTISQNSIELQAGIVFAGIEAGGTYCLVTGNNIRVVYPMGGEMYGIVAGAAGVGSEVSLNEIVAPFGITTTGNAVTGPVIKNNTINYKSNGIYTQTEKTWVHGNVLTCTDNAVSYDNSAGITINTAAQFAYVCNNMVDVYGAPVFYIGNAPTLVATANIANILTLVPSAITITTGTGVTHTFTNNAFFGTAPTAIWTNSATGTFKSAQNTLNGVRSLFGSVYVATPSVALAAAPASGTWALGDIVFNTSPTSGGYVGFVCTVAGTPGTWKTFGLIS